MTSLRKIKILPLLLIVSLCLSLQASVISAKTVVTTSGQNKIKKFASLADFKKFVAEQSLISSGPTMMMDKRMASGAVPVASPSAVSMEGANDFSKTNVQVEGVDEADIVKTDGAYIYSVSQNDLFIIDAREASAPRVVATINFKNQPQHIYVEDNKLVVLGYDYNFINTLAKSSFIRPSSGFTFVKVFDLADKSQPKELRSLRLEGDYSNSRLIKGYLYLVTNNYNYSGGGEILPMIYEGDKLINSSKTTARYAMPNIYYFDMPYRNLNLTTVAVVNVKDNKQAIKTEIYALPGTETLYASDKALYIAYSKYLDQAALMMQTTRDLVWSKLSASDREKINKIEAVESFILNSEEKLQKTNQIINNYLATLSNDEQEAWNKKIEEAVRTKILTMLDQLQVTVIHKIAIDAQALSYQGFVEVPGRIINQFALDESDGYLRVATTRDAAANFSYLPGLSDKRSNGVYIVDGKMKLVGRLEGLAPNEQIYSVRFMGSRAYLVTFEQTDPLLAIDLSKVTAPKLLGELKIPGFSQYLHPYDENTLIGWGRETNLVDGRVINGGLKMSLFDVSNIKAPREVAKVLVGGAGSDSSALYDHKAFLFARDKNLLVVPATLTKRFGANNSWDGTLDFNGALVFRVTKNELALRGQISQSDDKSQNNYQDSIKRALYIANNLFTISENKLQVNKLDSLAELAKLQLRKEVDYKIMN